MLDIALLFSAKLSVAHSEECLDVTVLLKRNCCMIQAHLFTTWREIQCNKLCKLQTARQCQTLKPDSGDTTMAHHLQEY